MVSEVGFEPTPTLFLACESKVCTLQFQLQLWFNSLESMVQIECEHISFIWLAGGHSEWLITADIVTDCFCLTMSHGTDRLLPLQTHTTPSLLTDQPLHFLNVRQHTNLLTCNNIPFSMCCNISFWRHTLIQYYFILSICSNISFSQCAVTFHSPDMEQHSITLTCSNIPVS